MGATTTQTKPLGGQPRSFSGYDRERAAYAARKPDLLSTAEGKFVVFVGDAMIGPFPTESDAERAGYQVFGLGPLYIKQILADDSVAVLPFGGRTCQS